QAELAMDDMRHIKRELSDDPMTLALSLKVHLTCFNVFAEFGLQERRAVALDEAWKDDRALQRFPDHPIALDNRWVFHWSLDKEADLLDATDKSNSFVMYFYALALHRRGEFKKAADVLAQTK